MPYVEGACVREGDEEIVGRNEERAGTVDVPLPDRTGIGPRLPDNRDETTATAIEVWLPLPKDAIHLERFGLAADQRLVQRDARRDRCR